MTSLLARDRGRTAAVEPAAGGRDRPDSDGWTMTVARALFLAGMVLLGVQTLRPVAGLQLSDILFLAVVPVLVLAWVQHRITAGMDAPAVLLGGVALFVIGGLASSLGAFDPLASVAVVARFVYVTVVWFWTAAVVLNSTPRVTLGMSAWVLSAAVCGLGAVIQYTMGSVISNTQIFSGRMTGFAQHPNDLGGIVAIAAGPAVALAVRKALRPASRALWIGATGLVVTGLLLSGSVGGWVAAAAGLLTWALMSRALVRAVAPVTALALVVIGLAALNPTSLGFQTPLERYATVVSPTSGSLVDRLLVDRIAIDVAMSGPSPFVGVGFDDQSARFETGRLIHNILLGVWVEAGTLALLGVVTVLAWILWQCRSVLRRARDTEEKQLGAAAVGAVVGSLAFGMGAPILFQRYAWVAAAFLVALRACQVRRSRQAPSPAASVES